MSRPAINLHHYALLVLIRQLGGNGNASVRQLAAVRTPSDDLVRVAWRRDPRAIDVVPRKRRRDKAGRFHRLDELA